MMKINIRIFKHKSCLDFYTPKSMEEYLFVLIDDDTDQTVSQTSTSFILIWLILNRLVQDFGIIITNKRIYCFSSLEKLF